MKPIMIAAAAALLAFSAGPGETRDRYGQKPPVLVSPDLAAPWVMQLRRGPGGAREVRPATRTYFRGGVTVRTTIDPAYGRPARRDYRRTRPAPDTVRTSAVAPGAARAAAPAMDPRFLPQTVDYAGPHKPGTIVIDTNQRFLFLVEAGGKARRYGVGVGKPGFEWAGTHKVTRKREWPDWRPPAEMIAREKKKGRILPVHMEGGPANPLGARALYLGSTLYRIHGTNQPETIGGAVSSGCIRMRNEDVMDLYERVAVGTKVVVI